MDPAAYRVLLMESPTVRHLKLVALAALCVLAWVNAGADMPKPVYHNAKWDPIHLKPAIETATDEQCLNCHREVLERRPRPQTISGESSEDMLAWYQTIDVYRGEQDSFHRRHLVTPEAKRLMDLRCNTCHQGHDPKDEISGSADDTPRGLTSRKSVDPEICVMCHGKFAWEVMAGLAGDWPVVRDQFKDDCVTCHKEYRTVRHQLNFLNAEEIEKAGQESSDSCYGCHGGRAWYAVPYAYVRRPWLERMPEVEPDWARGRPTEYDERFTR